ncbi:tegument protein UL51 [Common bottlenose dolphin gammaherpesvirus 1 strain Sarasota]|uniref:Tegument protein UL51 n=1 Tax=Common bottlenose dolphin gammaherpesvirus 1 strain Sarasota TaxID=2022783 RepID=A0A1Z1NE32_9GAMA|nr:tegument protein UL51 [Common bottlenose dolphin gammaherpesvirus 1 strain Sarasota]ARW78117.1 tegument protein UL51 [Common bottlenose dolphin gammaherpesvirus 1 strain Sarasota]
MDPAAKAFPWFCCGCWPFGRPKNSYSPLVEEIDVCSERWKAEINLGLPPGVLVGDILQGHQNDKVLKHAYLLAVQSNNISDYLRRFDSVKIPDSCKGAVNSQLKKLKAVQNVIWNAMIAMAAGDLTVNEEGLQTLLDKQAGDTLALLEMEKLAAVIAMDESTHWAANIAQKVVTVAPPPAREEVCVGLITPGDPQESHLTLPRQLEAPLLPAADGGNRDDACGGPGLMHETYL